MKLVGLACGEVPWAHGNCAKVKEKSVGRVFVYIFRRTTPDKLFSLPAYFSIPSIIGKSREWMVQ